MPDDKRKRDKTGLEFRENCPAHQRLKQWCENRDKDRYKSITDYFAEAVELMEEEHYIKLHLNIDRLTDEEMEAVGVLLRHRSE